MSAYNKPSTLHQIQHDIKYFKNILKTSFILFICLLCFCNSSFHLETSSAGDLRMFFDNIKFQQCAASINSSRFQPNIYISINGWAHSGNPRTRLFKCLSPMAMNFRSRTIPLTYLSQDDILRMQIFHASLEGHLYIAYPDKFIVLTVSWR